MSPTLLFFVTHFVFVLPYREFYGLEKTFFFSHAFLSYISFPHLPQYRVCCRFERRFLLSWVFYFTLLFDIWHSLLLSRLPWGLQYSLEGYGASYLGSKHRPSPYVCLNRTVFGKRYLWVGSINVLRSYGTLYQSVSGFEPTI